jgi:hypothetical protein
MNYYVFYFEINGFFYNFVILLEVILLYLLGHYHRNTSL